MEKYFRLILILIIGFILSFILSPIIDFFSGLMGFGIGAVIGYFFLCFAESKWGWFKNKK